MDINALWHNNTVQLKKLLHSDWLRAVQFKCNTSAKSVTPVQITNKLRFTKSVQRTTKTAYGCRHSHEVC